jgi:hypothetical protein
MIYSESLAIVITAQRDDESNVTIAASINKCCVGVSRGEAAATSLAANEPPPVDGALTVPA